ncbi:MAG: zf-TFIIB domain-containing protein [Kofleriaceae bacterium]
MSCPECYAPMEAISLHETHLDRCLQHGVWFDIGEITDVLRQNGRLEEGETAHQDKPSTGEKVGEAAAGVGAGILEVVGAVFDIVSQLAWIPTRSTLEGEVQASRAPSMCRIV